MNKTIKIHIITWKNVVKSMQIKFMTLNIIFENIKHEKKAKHSFQKVKNNNKLTQRKKKMIK